MTLSQFSEIFALLAVQLRQTDADEATIRAYFETLKDIEPEYLAMAATEMAKGAEWFPKTSEWRRAAAKIKHDRRDKQVALLRDLESPLCLACSDTGWALDDRSRAYRCECQTLRQLELLGRRPWPKLIAATPAPASPAETAALMQRIVAVVKPFPRIVPPVAPVDEDVEESA
jgi:hypothetical protein